MVATNPKQWKKAISGVELSLPSGNICLAKRVELRKLLNAGVIPNSLMNIVKEALKGKSVSMDSLAEEVAIDPAKLNDMLDFMDQVVLDCVLRPKVHPVPMRRKEGGDEGEMEPVPFDERNEDNIYIDEVDEMDKQHIFQFATGGTADVERFREQQASAVESLHAGAGSEDSSESSDGDQG